MELKTKLDNYLDRGGKLNDPFTEISKFNASQLANAIYFELAKAQERGQTHIKINMELVDAKALADFLKNRSKIVFI